MGILNKYTPRSIIKLFGKATPLQSNSTRSYAIRSTARINYASSIPTTKRYYPTEPPKQGIKIGHLFLGLTFIGLSATSYGLYQFYSTFTEYPSEIRTHLRAALRSTLNSEYNRADRSFSNAYALALALYEDPSNTELGSTLQEQRRRLTGIPISWAGMWEGAGEREKAIEIYERGYKVLVDAIEDNRERSSAQGGVANSGQIEKVSGKEVMRAVSMALKIGDIITSASSIVNTQGSSSDNSNAEVEESEAEANRAERYYVFAVEQMLRLSLNVQQRDQVDIEVIHQSNYVPETKDDKDEGVRKGLNLANEVSPLELASGLERLGEYYSRRGNIEYAQPLLVQAIAVLLPPPPKDGTKLPVPSIQVQCHAATLMNNLSSAIVSAPFPPTKERIVESAGWARQALVVAGKARTEGELTRRNDSTMIPLKDRVEVECELCSVVATYNLGALAEISKDARSARLWMEKSRLHSQRLGLKDGLARSEAALKRLN